MQQLPKKKVNNEVLVRRYLAEVSALESLMRECRRSSTEFPPSEKKRLLKLRNEIDHLLEQKHDKD